MGTRNLLRDLVLLHAFPLEEPGSKFDSETLLPLKNTPGSGLDFLNFRNHLGEVEYCVAFL